MTLEDYLMQLRDWDIWQTYSTVISSSGIDIKKLVNNLVEAEAFEFLYSDDGYCIWREEAGYEVGRLEAYQTPDTRQPAISLIDVDGKVAKLPDFAQECFYQSIAFLGSQVKLINTEDRIPSMGLRIFLGECRAKHESEKETIFYPVINVYQTGVVIVEFRSLSGHKTVGLEEFINSGVKLGAFRYEQFKLNHGMSLLIDEWSGKFHNDSLFRRLKSTCSFVSKVPSEFNEVESNNFRFKVSSVSSLDGQSFSDVAMSISGALKYLVKRRGSSITRVLFGLPKEAKKSRYWSGRPYIFIYNFDGQKVTASENEASHYRSFVKILNKVSESQHKLSQKRSNIKDLRMLDDYNFYITEAAALCVWSKEGVLKTEPKDPNHGHLNYEQQSIAEVMEYAVMMERRLLDEVEDFKNFETVLSTQKEILKFRSKLRRLGKYGEINDLLESGLSALKINAISSEVDTLLRLRSEEFDYRQRVYYGKLSLVIAVVVGLFSTPAFVQEFAKPLWRASELYPNLSAGKETFILYGLTFGAITTVAWGLSRIIRKR